jgi:hypothetical protein
VAADPDLASFWPDPIQKIRHPFFASSNVLTGQVSFFISL